MSRSSTCSFIFGVWLAVSCGPSDLEETRFPVLSQTGYPDGRGSAGSGSTAAAGAGGGPMQGSAGASNTMACPQDITQLFNRPIEQGGCATAGCHTPGNTSPDLVSPNPASRLLNVASTCSGRPYIGASDSFLVEKITDDNPECGAPMPFYVPGNLSAQDEACILDWIDEVVGR